MKAATTSRFHSPISDASRQRSASRRSMSSSRRSMRVGRLLIVGRNVERASDGIEARSAYEPNAWAAPLCGVARDNYEVCLQAERLGRPALPVARDNYEV